MLQEAASKKVCCSGKYSSPSVSVSTDVHKGKPADRSQGTRSPRAAVPHAEHTVPELKTTDGNLGSAFSRVERPGGNKVKKRM